jgi:hypothetical protein
MDPDITSSSKESHLIMLLNKNCEAAEQLALETVARMDMPILNSLRELTKGECWQILVSSIIRFLNKLQSSHVVLPLTPSPFLYKI